MDTPLLPLLCSLNFIIHTQLGLLKHIGTETTNTKDIFLISKKAEKTIGRLLKCIFHLKESLVFAFVCPFVKCRK